jgi:hypothetical protein
MARLPSAENMGGLPSASSGRSISSIDGSGIGQGMQNMASGMRALAQGQEAQGQGIARGAQAVSRGINDFAKEQERNALVKETLLDGERNIERMKLSERISTENNPDTIAELRGGFAKIDETFAAKIPDPQRRALAMNKWQQQTAGAEIQTNERHRTLYNDTVRASADNLIELQRRKAVTSTDPKVRQQAIDEVNGQFDRLFQAGVIKSPEELTLRKRKFVDGYRWDRFQQLTPQERYEASQPVKIGDRAKVAFQFFRGKNWSPAHAAGIVGNLSVESPNLSTTAVNRGDARDGTDSVGFAQWNQERLTGLKAFAAQNKADWRDFNIQLGYVQHELETSESRAAAKLREATTPREAAAAFAEYFLRPAGSGKGNPEGIKHFSSRARAAETVAAQFGGMKIEPTEGDRLYSSLPPEQQIQAREASERDVAQLDRITAQEYSRDVAIANAERSARNNELEVGIYDGRYGREEVMHRRAIGDVVDADQINKLDNLIKKQEEQIERRALSDGIVNRTIQYNPTNPEHVKALEERVEFAARATGKSKEEIGADVYNETGLMPKATVQSMRGRLTRGKEEDIIAVGEMAAKAMYGRSKLFENGNLRAFDGFDGGKEISDIGVMWAHFRGMMPKETDPDGTGAARRIMELRDPKFTSGVKMDGKEELEFKKNIKETALKDFKSADVFGSGLGSNQMPPDGLRAQMEENYAAEVLHYYKKHGGNEDLAREFGKKAIKALYGVSNGVLQKFPVEKALPNMQIEGSGHKWVYEAAAKRVFEATGGRDKIDPKDVFLSEIPLITSNAFRTQDQGVQYEIIYRRDYGGGQKALDKLYGTFVPAQHFAKAYGEYETKRLAPVYAERANLRAAGQQQERLRQGQVTLDDVPSVGVVGKRPLPPAEREAMRQAKEKRVNEVRGLYPDAAKLRDEKGSAVAAEGDGFGPGLQGIGDFLSRPTIPLKDAIKIQLGPRNRLPGGNK